MGELSRTVTMSFLLKRSHQGGIFNAGSAGVLYHPRTDGQMGWAQLV